MVAASMASSIPRAVTRNAVPEIRVGVIHADEITVFSEVDALRHRLAAIVCNGVRFGGNSVTAHETLFRDFGVDALDGDALARGRDFQHLVKIDIRLVVTPRGNENVADLGSDGNGSSVHG